MWPDPDVPCADHHHHQAAAAEPSPLLADNVCGLQCTRVAGFFYPQGVEDVQAVLRRARQEGKKARLTG
jgi:hypothetical protein